MFAFKFHVKSGIPLIYVELSRDETKERPVSDALSGELVVRA